tara:strand:+ start:378 stop:953 length:576 start_codon:yes stop_codon:yes gene_type:complete
MNTKRQVGYGYPGEKHVPLFVKGRLKQASYMGPGTNLIRRLQNEDKPLTYADRTAKLHDIMYSISDNANMIRHADNIMLKNLDKIEKKNLDNKFNINLGRIGIKAKTLGEDVGILKKGSFGGLDKEKVYSKEDKLLLVKNMKNEMNFFAGLGYCEGGQITLADVQRRMAAIAEDNKKRYRWDPVSKTMYKA